jgi:hypothetical protein
VLMALAADRELVVRPQRLLEVLAIEGGFP